MNSCSCFLCSLNYVLPYDYAGHRAHHNAIAKRLCIASRFALSKDTCKSFRANASPNLICEMTDLNIDPIYLEDPNAYLSHKAILSFLSYGNCNTGIILINKNRFISSDDNSYSGPLNILVDHGFLHVSRCLPSIHSKSILYSYGLTLMGFQALANCIDYDILCLPVLTK